MFDLALGEDITIIKDVVGRFCSDVLTENYRSFEANRSLPQEVLVAFHKLALAGLEISENLGGAALGAQAKIVVLEELGYGDPGAAFALDGVGAALYAVFETGGDSAVREHILPLLDNPETRAILVWDEKNRKRQNGFKKIHNGYQGKEPWVPAERADLVVILDRQGASLLKEGFSFEPVKGSGLRAAGGAELIFGTTQQAAPIAARWNNEAGAMRALARWQLYVSALLVGVMRVAAKTSREYAMERVAFGKPIAHHQALAFLIADMHTAVDATRLLVQDVACRADADLPFIAAAAAAFIEAVESSMFVTPNALQIFGGQGFMQDLPLEKFMREARTLGLMCGGVDLAREIAGREFFANTGTVELSAIATEDT